MRLAADAKSFFVHCKKLRTLRQACCLPVSENAQFACGDQQDRQNIGDVLRRAAVGDEKIIDRMEGDGRAQKAAGSGDFQPRPLPRIRQPSADDQAAEHVHGPRPEAPEKIKEKRPAPFWIR